MKFLSYLLLERNIINIETIDSIVDSVLKDLKDAAGHFVNIIPQNFKKMEKWIESNFKNFLLRDYEPVTKLSPTDSYVTNRIKKDLWIQKAIDRGDELFSITVTHYFRDDMAHVIDYFLANQNVNISRMSVPEAIRQSKEWTETIGKQKEIEEDPEGAKTIKKYSSGFYWVKITSEQAARREGILMHHSILTSCWPGIRSGEKAAYSLRDKDNIPHCTIDTRKDSIEQIKGNSNLKVKEKYIRYVKNFIMNPIEGKKYTKIKDLQNVGLMLVNDKIYDPENLPEDEGEFIEFAKHMTMDRDFWEKSKYYPRFLGILKKNVIFVDGKHKVVYKGEEIKVSLQTLKQLELDIPPKLALSILDTLPKPKLNSSSFRVYFPFTNVDKHRDALYKLQRLIRLKPDLREKTKNHPWIKALNLEVNTFIKTYVLPITYANLDDLLTKKTAQGWYAVPEFFRESLRVMNEMIIFLPEAEETKIRKTVFSHFYNDFVPGGPMTPEKENGLRVWKDIVQTVFDFLKKSEDKTFW